MSSVPMRFLPAYLQTRAQQYPGQVAASQTVVPGQGEDFLGPWQRDSQRLPQQGVHARTAYAGGYDPIARQVAAYGRHAGNYGPGVNASQQLNLSRQSGSRLREVGVAGPFAAAPGPTLSGGLRGTTRSNGGPSVGALVPSEPGALGTTESGECAAWAVDDMDKWAHYAPALSAFVLYRHYAKITAGKQVDFATQDAALKCFSEHIESVLGVDNPGALMTRSLLSSPGVVHFIRLLGGDVVDGNVEGEIGGWQFLPSLAVFGYWEHMGSPLSPGDVDKMLAAAKKTNWTGANWAQSYVDVAPGPWYTNPLYIGLGAAAAIGAVWLLTR